MRILTSVSGTSPTFLKFNLQGVFYMYKWWAFVRTGLGTFIKVTIYADNQYQATEMLRGMYGDNLQCEAAMANDPEYNVL